MLQPRETDVLVLFMVLVLLPLFTYILLGIWNEATKKKARIGMLTQLAAEEASNVESNLRASVAPAHSSKTNSQVCAWCFSPATTRCSRCKSIRYCSGKCQIVHWRRGHREECNQWQDNNASCSAPSYVNESVEPKPCTIEESSMQIHGDDREEQQSSDISSDIFDDLCVSYDSDVPLSGETSNFDAASPTLEPTTLFSDVSSRNISFSLNQKSGKNNCTSDGPRRKHERGPIFGKAPTILKNIMLQSYKSTGKMRTESKDSILADKSSSILLERNAINDCKCGVHDPGKDIVHNDKFSSSAQTVKFSSGADKKSEDGPIKYKKPPYTVPPTILLSKRSGNKLRDGCFPANEKIIEAPHESRFPFNCDSYDIPDQRSNGLSDIRTIDMEGQRKFPKVPRRNLVGFLMNNKKRKVLFPYEELVNFFRYESWDLSPRGLLNCGNSCYANAVLQCLTGTKPLMLYLLQRIHSRTCCVQDWCLMCELELHVSMLREGDGPLSPNRILSNMRNIGWRMENGNQEDAHEFLRLLVMSMQSICLQGLGGEKKVDPVLQETTLIQQIFGGRLRSKVECMKCHLESERYENIMDLTLEIHGWVESLEDALTQFTSPEDLDGENKYRCGRCLAYVEARKQLSVHEVPNILTLVLKRFQSGQYGKINKCVIFPDMLDMIPFVTGTADKPPLYMLYAVVVHLDNHNASFSGHYVSYIKDLKGTWYRIDDSEVQPVPLSQVLSECAYMLFYSRPFPRPPRPYLEKSSLQVPIPLNHMPSKMLNSSRCGQDKNNNAVFASAISDRDDDLRQEYNMDMNEHIQRPSRRNITRPSREMHRDLFSMEFSNVSSSDWPLFTSSDDSSFTTESTRDSFSTVDYNADGAGLDTISSIFGPYHGLEGSRTSII